MKEEEFWINDLSKFLSYRIFPNSSMSRNEQLNAWSRMVVLMFIVLIPITDLRFASVFLFISLLLMICLHCKSKSVEEELIENFGSTQRRNQKYVQSGKYDTGLMRSSSTIPTSSHVVHREFDSHSLRVNGTRNLEEFSGVSRNKTTGRNVRVASYMPAGLKARSAPRDPRTFEKSPYAQKSHDLGDWGDGIHRHSQVNQKSMTVSRRPSFKNDSCINNKKGSLPKWLDPRHCSTVSDTQVVCSDYTDPTHARGGIDRALPRNNRYDAGQDPYTHSYIENSQPIDSDFSDFSDEEGEDEEGGASGRGYRRPFSQRPCERDSKYAPIGPHEVYDPRSYGYGSRNREYICPVTKQVRYYYDDIDSARRPNFVSRSNIDFEMSARGYGSRGVNSSKPDLNSIKSTVHKAWYERTGRARDRVAEAVTRRAREQGLHRRRRPMLNQMPR